MQTISENFQTATQVLAENLVASEPFVAYHQAVANLDNNPEAHMLLERVSAVQTRIRLGQQNNNVVEADVNELRTLQAELQKNKVIMEYTYAQQGAVNYLREINQVISQMLGVDFAQLSRSNRC